MNVRAIASVPRDWGFRLHWKCQLQALAPLGLMPEEAGGAFWHQTFENLIERAIADGCDYVLTLDFDCIFDSQHVLALLDLAKEHPEADCIVPWMVKRDSEDRIFGVRGVDGVFRRRFDESEFEADLMPIDTGHFGLTLIRLAALKDVPRPLFLAVPDSDGHWYHDRVDADIFFWNQARAAGLRCFLATKVRVGHLQQMITWPTADFGVTHQHVEDFTKHGTLERQPKEGEPVILDSRGDFLRDCGFNFTSQFGEDGYIRAVFEKIDVQNKWCFEVGAADGQFYSNTARLRNVLWNSVLIEADETQFAKLQTFANERTHCVNERIGPDSLDRILGEAGAPADLDFGVIDIDGPDYYIWQGLREFRPRVMLVEFSPYGRPDNLPAPHGTNQAGLNPIVALGKEKGYVPLLHTFCNVLFVREDQLQ